MAVTSFRKAPQESGHHVGRCRNSVGRIIVVASDGPTNIAKGKNIVGVGGQKHSYGSQALFLSWPPLYR